MKIFKFDPITGKRGEQINDKKVSSYGGGRLAASDLIDPKLMPVIPTIKNQDWNARIDAGVYKGGEPVSYLADQWICFCIGELSGADTDTDTGYAWDWTVLPPKQLLIK